MIVKIMRFFLPLLFFCSSNMFASVNADNPAIVYNKFMIALKEKKWNVLTDFFSYSRIELTKIFYNQNKDNPDEIKNYLKKHGVVKPSKTTFSDYRALFAYILKESKYYKSFFEAVSKPFWKVLIDYYHIDDLMLHSDEFYKLFFLDYSQVRKLKFFNESTRFFIRRDLKGWYISV
jgi:hypothetical protein